MRPIKTITTSILAITALLTLTSCSTTPNTINNLTNILKNTPGIQNITTYTDNQTQPYINAEYTPEHLNINTLNTQKCENKNLNLQNINLTLTDTQQHINISHTNFLTNPCTNIPNQYIPSLTKLYNTPNTNIKQLSITKNLLVVLYDETKPKPQNYQSARTILNTTKNLKDITEINQYTMGYQGVALFNATPQKMEQLETILTILDNHNQKPNFITLKNNTLNILGTLPETTKQEISNQNPNLQINTTQQ